LLKASLRNLNITTHGFRQAIQLAIHNQFDRQMMLGRQLSQSSRALSQPRYCNREEWQIMRQFMKVCSPVQWPVGKLCPPVRWLIPAIPGHCSRSAQRSAAMPPLLARCRHGVHG